MYFIILQQKSKHQEYMIAGIKYLKKKNIYNALEFVFAIIK